MKPSSHLATARRITTLDQNLIPTNSVVKTMVTVATGTMGWPKYKFGSGGGRELMSLMARAAQRPSRVATRGTGLWREVES